MYALRACEWHDDDGVLFAAVKRPEGQPDALPVVVRDDFATLAEAQQYVAEVNALHEAMRAS